MIGDETVGLSVDIGGGLQLGLLPGTSHEGMLNRVEWLSSMVT